jgi:hypothetical protein
MTAAAAYALPRWTAADMRAVIEREWQVLRGAMFPPSTREQLRILFGTTWPSRITTAVALILYVLFLLDGIARVGGQWQTGIWPNPWSPDVPVEQWFQHRIQWDVAFRADHGITTPGIP